MGVKAGVGDSVPVGVRFGSPNVKVTVEVMVGREVGVNAADTACCVASMIAANV